MHRHQGEDQVHLRSLGSANYGATRTGRCYYRLGPFVFGVYVHRRRRPRPRLCLLTNSATIALSQSLGPRMHRRTRIVQGPCESRCNLFAPFLCGAQFLDESAAEAANELCLNSRHQTNRLQFQSIRGFSLSVAISRESF